MVALLLDLNLELNLLLDLNFWLARLGMLVMVDPLDCSDVTVSTDGWCLSCCLDLWDGLVAFAGCGVLLVCLDVNVGLETLETFEVCDPPPETGVAMVLPSNGSVCGSLLALILSTCLSNSVVQPRKPTRPLRLMASGSNALQNWLVSSALLGRYSR